MAFSNGGSLMETDNHKKREGEGEDEEEDPFLAFIEYARSVISPEEDEDPSGNEEGYNGAGWSWIASRILKTCISYSSGVTAAILLSDLSQAWSEQRRVGGSKKRPEIIDQMKRKHRRAKLPNTVTIDSIYEKNFLSLSSVLEAVVVDAHVLPGTNIYMLTLGDYWSSNTIDLYLHRRYYDLVDPPNGILKKAREIFLTGCYLRTAKEGCGSPRLLPTEYLVILLDEDLDDDAILIGAQFCSDSFSSISHDGVKNGVSYSLYARIESISSLEILEQCGGLQRKQITLVDNDGVKLRFLLWNEQVILANLISVGSMLALDRPYIAIAAESALETSDEFCLEYGTATQLYLVPFVQHEEQVCLSSTQNRTQGSKLHAAADPTQGPKVSQICRVWIDQVDHCHVTTRFSHAPCGHFVKEMPSGAVQCSFCHCDCDSEVVMRAFYLKLTLADKNTKIFAWCTGQTAMELLQISPDEFYELSEDEQVMYPSSLENERFIVALVNCKRQAVHGSRDSQTPEADAVSWEITRALKCE